ncbi:hypothetical protein SAMN03080617_01890 [Algoriphagus alkaliphilus]|uniref:Uncharacterized protein n=1 Tax=Algoriphagus alkaliphilus TaxID=279824 RepID=A0A1G5XNN2_9BACT|nr:hypothetical protein [Cyclobacterium sp.]SDA71790.1 hypothetical protein SAMN03080617_01890 [Algoriphagus alkaliphilus]
MNYYFKNFSYKDMLSAFIASLISISIIFSLQLEVTKSNLFFTILLTFFIPISIMHIIYWKDHQKKNNSLGRITHDLLFILITFLLLFTILKINNIFYKIGSANNLITLLFICVFVSEIVFSISINFLLRLVKNEK